MFTISLFRNTENKHDEYRSEDCMENFCEFLRELPMKIINFKKKQMKLSTKEQQESNENAKSCQKLSSYDYHFIKKVLAEEFKKYLTCLQDTEKYITFRVPLEKEVTKIDKNG